MIQQTLSKSMFTRTSHSLGTLPAGKPKAANSNDIHYPETSITDKKDERTEINRPWQNDHIQTKRQAELSPELANRINKLTKTTYAVTTHNRFQDLETENNEGPSEQHKEPKPPKPEPIFVTGVLDIKNLKELLSLITDNNNYTMTTLRSGHIVKIMPADIDTYKSIRANFIEKDVSHYTYKLKSERAYRVLRGLHSSEDTESIKQELYELGHDVRQITNVRHKDTKQPLPLFFIDLEPKHNNKEIFNVNLLNHAKISFEAPYKKFDILQCKRCQRFGHAKNQCNRPFRCVKCGDDHASTSCLKRPDTEATCANCQGKHPASYKGCAKYKQYKELLLTKGKSRKTNDNAETIMKQTRHHTIETAQLNNQINHLPLNPNPNIPSTQVTRPLKPNTPYTYAQAARQKDRSIPKTDIKDPNDFVEVLDAMVDKFQNIMTLMLDNMMDRMIQLVTSLIKHS
ncbi:Nucleic-acid-binding protein from transposon X-element [Eumeta japonica]|uniref:Nucleic-acid-binding protein from transposon X-element n=1 Tax=Eumeta variegata TaxID=151549 RepID=A0A4C1YV18_EUMVA|nr:Nucleic-acid-binding protein from transposon X-element [Eumeta japonica]